MGASWKVGVSIPQTFHCSVYVQPLSCTVHLVARMLSAVDGILATNDTSPPHSAGSRGNLPLNVNKGAGMSADVIDKIWPLLSEWGTVVITKFILPAFLPTLYTA